MISVPDDEDLPDLITGVYKHYKGDLYQVDHYVVNSTNGHEGEVSVEYHSIRARPGIPHKHRRVREFFEWVHIDDGTACPGEVMECTRTVPADQVLHRRRFAYLGPDWDEDDLS